MSYIHTTEKGNLISQPYKDECHYAVARQCKKMETENNNFGSSYNGWYGWL